MSKIIWISSYPKSGNTFLRILLSTYFFTNDGNYKQLLLKNIHEYPREYFEYSPNNSISKEAILWEMKQLDISKSSKNFIFLKTHMAHCDINNKYKTLVPNLSKCIIYIYRDPRNVLSSLKDFFDLDIENAKKVLFDKKNILRLKNASGLQKNFTPTLDWASNYKSYKINENKIPTLFIKYEDLVKNTEEEFLKILEFLKGKYISFEINKEKINKTLNTTTFNKLKILEKEEGFIETTDAGNINNKLFFFKGRFREYKKELSSKDANEVFQNFYSTMKELGYV
tara:strand:+ start:370 stop:1218 length:849 start_codon:yes stop_codon:yes gene_type:complete